MSVCVREQIKISLSHSYNKNEIKNHIVMVTTAVAIDYDDNIQLQPKKRHVL